jgi:hypothetical protein
MGVTTGKREAADRSEDIHAPDSGASQIILAVCAFASIVPLFCARHLPMSDLPEHLASMATIRHYGDPTWKSAEYFTVAGMFETPYWAYHGVGALLTALMGSAERANLLMLSIVGLAYPYALRWLLVALRRDPRLAIFGSALFWTTNMLVGLLNFIASIPLLFAALALVVRHAEAPNVRRWLGLAAITVALFYLHLSSFALFLLDAALLTWMLPVPTTEEPLLAELRRRLVRLPGRLLWSVPAVLLGLMVFLAGRTISHGQGPGAIWKPRFDLVKGLFGWLFDCFKSRWDEVLGALLVLTLVVLLTSTGKREQTFDERWRSRCVQILAAIAAIVWVASPSQIGNNTALLEVRMAPYVALFAVMLPRVAPGRRATLSFAAAAICALGLAVNTAWEVHGFERDDVAGFDELLRKMPHGKRLVMLNLQPQSTHVKSSVFSYFGSYYRARYGGVASFSFSETSHWPVQYRPSHRPPSSMQWANPCLYNNEHDGAYFDYVLVRGERDPMASMPHGPRWELVGASRIWRLYQKSTTEPQLPPGDEPDPGPCGALASAQAR